MQGRREKTSQQKKSRYQLVDCEKKKRSFESDTRAEKKLYQWFVDHPLVVQSPIKGDVLLLKDPLNSKVKVKTPKLLLQVPITELYDDLMGTGTLGKDWAKKPDGSPLICDTSFRALKPPQLRTMSSRHKQMCGCEICIMISQMQGSLNNFCRKWLKKLEDDAKHIPERNSDANKIAIERASNYKNAAFLNGKPLHQKPKDAVKTIMCPKGERFQLPHMRCILR